MGKKKRLLKMHPDSKYITGFSAKKNKLDEHFIVFDNEHYIIYRYVNNSFVKVNELQWSNIKIADVDHFFMKSIYTFHLINGQSETIKLSDNRDVQKIDDIIKLNVGTLQVIPRKSVNKVFGYRSRKTWKAITTLLLLLIMISTFGNIFADEESGDIADSANEKVNSTEVEKVDKKDEPSKSDKGKIELEKNQNEKEEVAAKKAAEEKAKLEQEAKEKASAKKAKLEQEAKEKASAKKAKAAAEIKKTEESQTNATVARVIDGDTIEVSMNDKTEDVRLLLIDTPETVHPSEPVQPFGPEASQFVKDTLTGEKVRVKVGTEERDRYGRLLAYVFINGTTIQEMLLKKGLARTAYLYNDLTMLDAFHKAQATPKANGNGVWSIPGYAHADHDHGYHYQEEPEPEPEPKKKKETNSDLKYDPFGPDRDCGDFDTHQQAQNFYEAAGGPDSDRHRLDRDNEGLACDSLP